MRTAILIAMGFALAACTDREADRLPVDETAPAETAELPPGITSVPAPTASVALAPTEGHNASGSLSVTQEGDVVRISGQLSNLTPGGVHGFHIHETGDCRAPDASSAGAHFNPTEQPHGEPEGDAHHAGDLFNVEADDQGIALVDQRTTGVTLGDGGPNDIAGRALIVHEKADDYATQPSGDSGSRIACGVIEMTDAAPSTDTDPSTGNPAI